MRRSAILLSALLSAPTPGCSAHAARYQHGTCDAHPCFWKMTEKDIDYHRSVVTRVFVELPDLGELARSGRTEDDAKRLDAGCELLRQHRARAPSTAAPRADAKPETQPTDEGPVKVHVTTARALLDRDMARICGAAVAVRKAGDERRRTEEDAETKRALRESAVRTERALEAALERCTKDLTARHCDADGAAAGQVLGCRTTCQARITEGVDRATAGALEECVRKHDTSAGKTGLSCDLALPAGSDVPEARIDATRAACSQACAKEAPLALEASKRHAEAKRRAPETERSYRLCMVTAARAIPKVVSEETGLKRDYLETARTRCRTQSRCELLETNRGGSCRSDFDP